MFLRDVAPKTVIIGQCFTELFQKNKRYLVFETRHLRFSLLTLCALQNDYIIVLLVRPEAIACGGGLKFYCGCFIFLFFLFSTRDLRDAWADRREILHG